MINHTRLFVILFSLLLFFASCRNDNSTPKPRGYYRIDLPEKNYKEFSGECPYSFEYPEYSKIISDPYGEGNKCWLNIYFPGFNGNIHISFKEIEGNLSKYIEDSRNLVYKHTVKAEAISEKRYSSKEKEVYGILYSLKGNVASPMQFFMTDSTEYFIRGSLYFRTEPNKDSIAPVLGFVEKDIIHLINTLEWE